MNFGFASIPWFSKPSKKKDVAMGATIKSATALVEQAEKRKGVFDIKIWAWSLISVIPWAIIARDQNKKPTTINRGLKRHAQSHWLRQSGAVTTVYRFRPYVSKVPWHTGPRAFLSQLFPRYGHYCGPNWSSGKDQGSPLWDQRPIDWLDYCCYCHDIGYDTHDQAELLKADLAFLECLESHKHVRTKGDAHVAHLYKTMCITGCDSLIVFRIYKTLITALEEMFNLCSDLSDALVALIPHRSQEPTNTIQKLPFEDTTRAQSTRFQLAIQWHKTEKLEFPEELRNKKQIVAECGLSPSQYEEVAEKSPTPIEPVAFKVYRCRNKGTARRR